MVIIGLLIIAVCFGFGYIMNPTNTTSYNYRKEELWEAPAYWNFEQNVPEVATANTLVIRKNTVVNTEEEITDKTSI